MKKAMLLFKTVRGRNYTLIKNQMATLTYPDWYARATTKSDDLLREGGGV